MFKKNVDPAVRRRNRKRRLIVYGSLLASIWLFYAWQPYQVDLFVRRPKRPMWANMNRVDLWSSSARVLIVTAHPDDSELFAGGTLLGLAGRAAIAQAIVTDGDKSYYGPFTNADENRKVRAAEARAAFDRWQGSRLEFLHQPDGRSQVTDEVVARLRGIIEEFHPTHVLTFDGDCPVRVSHADHRNAGIAAERALRESGRSAWILRFQTSSPNGFVDLDDVYDDKLELIKVHASQFTGRKLNGIQGLIASMAERNGELVGVSWAEGFRVDRIP